MKFRDASRHFVGQYSNSFTREGYLQTLDLLKRWVGEEKDIAKITTPDLLDFANDIRSNYQYAPTTIYRHIKQTKIFFNWLQKMQFISNNPATALRNPAPAKEVNRDKAMGEAELEIILRYAYHDPLKHAVVLFLADTGARAGGVSSLTMDRLYLSEKKAEVIEKGNKKRFVYFEDECEESLNRWLAKRREMITQALDLGFMKSDHGFVFCHEKGPYKPDAISQIIYRLSKEAGLDRALGSHSLRHRKGHQLADAGVAPSVAANVLGHSDVSITLNFYYPHDDQRAEEAARKLAYQSTKQPAKILRIAR